MSESLGIRPYRGHIPAEQIVRGMEVIDENARELLDDAKFLLENERYARAVSLSVIALEESAKKSGLLALYAVQGDEKLRKKVWQEYRSHPSKASFIVRRPAVLGAFEGQNIEEKAKRMGKMMDMLKQMGFYADSYETGEGMRSWHTPSKNVTPDLAKDTFQMVSKSIGTRSSAKSETGKEKIREFRWQVIQAIDKHPQDHIQARIRAMLKATLEATRGLEPFEKQREFFDFLEKNTQQLLEEEEKPTKDV